VGDIDISDRFSLVEVPSDMADAVITSLRRSKIKGKKVTVRRERDKD
jgi:ATP-dependent RNA helicase DeaD